MPRSLKSASTFLKGSRDSPLEEMTQALFDYLPQIASSMRDAAHVLVFLDFDGTLAPLHPYPGAASMPQESRRALKTLKDDERSSVAIISGRALPDLRERVRMEEIIYAGNHGLEIVGPTSSKKSPGTCTCGCATFPALK